MPYASTSGASKRASACSSTEGGRAALQERMKRKAPLGAWSSSARVSRIWWMVGDPEYQVALSSRTWGQKELAQNLVKKLVEAKLI